MSIKVDENAITINKTDGVSLYSVGTLVYSRASLFTLFAWLLWGNFIFTIMSSVMPYLLPILLKGHGASNKQIAFLGSTIYMLTNMILNPILGYRSDRYRSRWGRRRPFILWTTPFVTVFMALIPFAPEILAFFSKNSAIAQLLSYSPITPLILVFGLFIISFQFFEMFVASVYYYLIPDVVPKSLLGRFYGLFQLFSALGSLIFNYFLYGLATNYMNLLFVGIAVVYGLTMMVVCWRVKEGEYPPPPQEKQGRFWSGINNYVRECFGTSYFWWVHLAKACVVWFGISGIFMVFFYRNEMGFSLDGFGKLMALGNVLSFLIVFPAGLFLDKLGSHKMLIFTQLLCTIICVLAFFTINTKWLAGFWLIAFSCICLTLPQLVTRKWSADIYPPELYGQFASASAIFSSVGSVGLSLLCGVIMDWLNAYRFFWLWSAFFAFLGAVLGLVVYLKAEK
ncbi:MAG: hypothetical protein A2Y12_09405 [Planctomycetes bacterium GWF2_42_9]|nr:MAG: hypothetical protein A2Y12_09405 [Planctomycetes bacterium GWF2_42_9]